MNPPPTFSQVYQGVYRSAYPNIRTLQFVKSLQLKSLICLNPADIREELRQFCKENDVYLFEAYVGINQEPFLQMSHSVVADVIKFAKDEANHPILIFCTKSSHRLHCTIGCLRKSMNWSMVSIIHEYQLFCSNQANNSALDIQFIDSFEI